MFNKIKNIKWDEYSLSFLLSIIFHSVLFLGTALIFSFHFEKTVANSVYLTFEDNDIFPKVNNSNSLIKDKPKHKNPVVEKSKETFYNFNRKEYDTSAVKQIYKESTLNVSVRYPDGWTYLDQNVKNKLDGVTFWAVQGKYEYPPYVHLDVKEKYLFNPSRFKNKLVHNEHIFYYNEPEELEGYFTQIIYIRTDSDEDYSLKLMVKGKETFQSFQPVFFSMAKSFSFGKTFF